MFKQTDYPQTIGKGTRTITQDGSLLVAFSNLLTRLKFDITPERLNNYFTNKEIYINNDQLTWNSIGQYATVGIDVQTEMNEYSVVRIEKDGASVFALVDNPSANTVIDSLDGTSKVISELGEAKEFYAYKLYEPIAYNETKIEQTPPEPVTGDVYTVVSPISGYSSSAEAAAHGTDQVVVQPGIYYIFNQVAGMINVTPNQGQVGYWINPNDNEAAKSVIAQITPDVTESPVSDVQSESSASPVIPEDDTSVPVKIIPPDPNKWQSTYKANLGMVEYKSTASIMIHDLAGTGEDKLLPKDALVPVAGEFSKDGVTYVRTVKSVGDGTWYGVPKSLVTKSDNEDGDINEAIDNINLDLGVKNAKAIKAAGTASGTVSRLSPLNLFNKGKK